MTLHSEIVVYLFLVPSICVFGIIGNILTLVVLVRGKFFGGAFVYLKGLAIFDLLSLVFILPICLVRCPICDFRDSYALNFYEAYIYICIGDIFLKASVWTTLLLTVERCLVIVFRKKLHVSKRRSRFPVCALVGIFLFTTAQNLPTVFAYSVDREDGTVILTAYGSSLAFEVYSWGDAVLFQFLPFVILFTFNIILARYLLQHRQVSQRLKASVPQSFTEYRFTAERRTLLMLTGIIGLFLATMVPCSIMQLVGINVDYGSGVYARFQMAVTVLVSLNFSCNFLLYCVLNRRFWEMSKALLCACSACKNRVKPFEISPRCSLKVPSGLCQSESFRMQEAPEGRQCGDGRGQDSVCQSVDQVGGSGKP